VSPCNSAEVKKKKKKKKERRVAKVTVIMDVSVGLANKVGHNRSVRLWSRSGQVDGGFQGDLRRGRGEMNANRLVWKFSSQYTRVPKPGLIGLVRWVVGYIYEREAVRGSVSGLGWKW
jgi:uncharacterized protein YcfJ